VGEKSKEKEIEEIEGRAEESEIGKKGRRLRRKGGISRGIKES